MPYRKTPFVNNYFYHLLNRGVNRKNIFKEVADYERVLQVINFYRFPSPSIKFSDFINLPTKNQQRTMEQFSQKIPLVSITSFCLMPNHIHLLLKQNVDKGISIFMSNWQNSYARYFNIKYKTKGYLFESNFKAVLIDKEEVLWHVNRYIHLNPSSASLVTITKLEDYPWSSLPDYLYDKRYPFVDRELILGHFQSRNVYRKFVFNQAAYQKKLQRIKNLILEENI